jgi:hypothetical protein
MMILYLIMNWKTTRQMPIVHGHLSMFASCIGCVNNELLALIVMHAAAAAAADVAAVVSFLT